MGFNTGGYIFDPVCRKLQTSFIWPQTRQVILVTLIKALQAQDWDTEYESLELFTDDPVVVAAFRETCPEMFEDTDFGGREIEHADHYERD